MSRVDPESREKAERILAGIRSHLADEVASPRDKAGFGASDLHTMFDGLGWASMLLWADIFVRFAPDAPDLNVTVPPNDFLGDEVLRRAVQIIDQHASVRDDPPEEEE